MGKSKKWTPADLERYRSLGLPKLLQAGAKTISLANHFENNMITWGVSNFCVTVDCKVADSVDEERLCAFCADARAAGATVQMWGNTAISTLNLLFVNRVGNSDRIRFLPHEGSIMEALDRNTSFVRNASNRKTNGVLAIDERQGSNHRNSAPLGGCEAILGAVDFFGYGIGPVNICAYLFFNTDQLYVFLTKSRLR